MRALPPSPADVTLTVIGKDRYWVSEALLDAALRIEGETDAGRRRKVSTYTQVQLAVAGRLRDMAGRVR